MNKPTKLRPIPKLLDKKSIKPALIKLLNDFEEDPERQARLVKACKENPMPEIHLVESDSEENEREEYKYLLGVYEGYPDKVVKLFWRRISKKASPERVLLSTLAHELRHWLQDITPGFKRMRWISEAMKRVYSKFPKSSLRLLANFMYSRWFWAVFCSWQIGLILVFGVGFFWESNIIHTVQLFWLVAGFLFVFCIALFFVWRALYILRPVEKDAHKFAEFAVKNEDWLELIQTERPR